MSFFSIDRFNYTGYLPSVLSIEKKERQNKRVLHNISNNKNNK